MMTWPPSPVLAASTPSTRRNVAVCAPPSEEEEAYPKCADVGNGHHHSMSIFELVRRRGRERLARVVGPGGFLTSTAETGSAHVHDQDRLARLARLREGIEIGQVQTRVSVREASRNPGRPE